MSEPLLSVTARVAIVNDEGVTLWLTGSASFLRFCPAQGELLHWAHLLGELRDRDRHARHHTGA